MTRHEPVPDGFNLHDPSWWEQDDAAFGAQMDAYAGQPLTEQRRAELLNVAFYYIARIRIVQKLQALEQQPESAPQAEQPKPRRRRAGP